MCSARSLGSASSSFSRARSSSAVAPRRRVPARGRLVTIPILDAAEDFRAGADQRAGRAFQIEHERRGVDDAQGAVDVERIGGGVDAQALAGDELEDVAGLDVFLAGANHLLELLAGAVGGEGRGDMAPAGSISPRAELWRLLEAGDDVVDSPAGVAIGGFGACVRRPRRWRRL